MFHEYLEHALDYNENTSKVYVRQKVELEAANYYLLKWSPTPRMECTRCLKICTCVVALTM